MKIRDLYFSHDAINKVKYLVANSGKDIVFRNGMLALYTVLEIRKQDNCKSYVVSESLAEALTKVDFSEVGPWHLSGTQAYSFIFKKNTLDNKDEKYSDMFVTILPPKSVVGICENSHDTDHKVLILVTGPENEKGQISSVYIGSRFKKGNTIEDILNNTKEDLGEMKIDQDHKMNCIKLALNLILYVNSPEPDIMVLKPQIYNTKNFRENFFPKPKKESDLVGMYSLGWDFHGRNYSVEFGVRKGHYRWQPCGPQRQQLKLIFIEATTVNYSKKH